MIISAKQKDSLLIIELLLFFSSLSVLLYCFRFGLCCCVTVGLLCDGWIMGDLKTTFFQSRRAQARKKTRAIKAARPRKAR